LFQIHDRAGALRDADMAKPYLDAGELDAQHTEQIVNRELNNPQE